MKTKVQLNKNTPEVLANKAYSAGQGSAGGYTFLSDADYWIIVEEDKIQLKSIFNDVEYHSDIEEVDSINHKFQLKGKEYRYKIVD